MMMKTPTIVNAASSRLAHLMATKVIKYTKNIRNINEVFMWCKDCRRFPFQPVTGMCGHTRCSECVEANGPCPCGANRPVILNRNILIENLLPKMLRFRSTALSRPRIAASPDLPTLASPRRFASCGTQTSPPFRRQRLLHRLGGSSPGSSNMVPVQPRQLFSPRARFDYARELLASSMYMEAAPHLAHVAASVEPCARRARILLAEAIEEINVNRNSNSLRDLYRAVREEGIIWPKLNELECVVCYEVFRQPVTTPCGHTFCRCCVERLLYYTGRCPLCARSLVTIDLLNTADTRFISAMIAASVDLPAASSAPDGFIPIFACAVAYPGLPCPLLTGPRFWETIKRVLQSESRKLGVVAYHGRNKGVAMFGTLVEVRDCMKFEDGSALLSTVGGPRFQIIERIMVDGCNMAQIQEMEDIVPRDYLVTCGLKELAQQIFSRASMWLETVNPILLANIESVFGQMPMPRFDGAWWEDRNGPQWLWWIVALLPLNSEMQVLMLSTPTLLKRLQAVLRTLELMHEYELKPSVPPTHNDCHLENELFIIYHNQLG